MMTFLSLYFLKNSINVTCQQPYLLEIDCYCRACCTTKEQPKEGGGEQLLGDKSGGRVNEQPEGGQQEHQGALQPREGAELLLHLLQEQVWLQARHLQQSKRNEQKQ